MIDKLKKLCTPAMLYFALSIVSFVVMIIANGNNEKTLCIGDFECPTDNVYMLYFFNLIYILFFTIVLDSLCKNGFTPLSWLLVLFPIVMFFVLLGLFMVYQNKTISMENFTGIMSSKKKKTLEPLGCVGCG
tara:strand:- start:4306 stop:4701 length:396 start_codon:yes stop_codon:yes gene_type:complete